MPEAVPLPPVMPVTPIEIMLAKIAANGLVIVIASLLSIETMVRIVLGVPIAGSLTLFTVGMILFMFSVTSLGLLLATFARTMPQFGLLALPVMVILYLLSGSTTPLFIEHHAGIVGSAVLASATTAGLMFVAYQRRSENVLGPHLHRERICADPFSAKTSQVK